MITTSRRIILAVSSAILVSTAAACSSDSNTPPPSGESTQSTSPEFRSAPVAPSITQPSMTTIAPDRKAADTLAKGGAKAQDAWFLGTMRAANVKIPDDSMLDLRQQTCRMLHEGSTLVNISDQLASWPLDDTQKGVLISSSMVSSCPDTHVEVDESAVPEMEDPSSASTTSPSP